MDLLDNDIEFPGLSEYSLRQLARFPASHHSSPLTYYPQRHVVALISGDTTLPRTPLLMSLAAEINRVNSLLGGGYSITDDPARVYSHFFELSLVDSSYSNSERSSILLLGDCLKVVVEELRNDINAIKDAHPGMQELRDPISLEASVLELISEKMARNTSSRQLLERVRNMIQQNHISRDETLHNLGITSGVNIFVTREFALFAFGSPANILVILNYDQILMLYDTISCRYMVRLTLELNALERVDNLPPWELIKQIYKWGDSLISRYGVDAYSVIGEFESIVTGIFVTFPDSDPLDLGAGFMQSITETSMETELEFRIPASLTMELVQILRNIDSINWLSEVFGIRKHWGNPMVNAVASGAAVQEKVAEELPVSGSAMVKLLASFNRMITIEFIQQHGKWPTGSFPENLTNCPIKRAFESNNTRVPETALEHKHEHWAMFKFGANCILDSYYNDLSMISDKSISVYKSHLDVTYVRGMCNFQLPTDVDENRRLILEYIRKKHLPVLDIFKIVMTNSIPDEWLANCAAMKGTEMKHIKARIFAVLTYELRQYFAATEDIIKKNLFRYNPHQTMTLGESELLTRLKNITKQLDPDSDSKFLSVIHIVDFSKWNLRMRYLNTCLTFKSIDDFLGTPGLIEQTHWIFSNMTNIVQDAFNPPESGVSNTESSTVWRNHNCGWEGQRQGGWTIMTSALLSDIARSTGVKCTISGQGDNQTLLAQFPIPTNFQNARDWIQRDAAGVKSTLDQFYKKLETECSAIGLKVKTAETCRSLSYFNYGKRLYFNGVELSMTLKRISKNITEPNESYPTSESLLKTLEGSAFAAGLYSHPSLIPYVIGRTSLALQLHSCFSNNQLVNADVPALFDRYGLTMTRRFLSVLMKIPASLGGPPQLTLASYLFRGHPDPLCTELVGLILRARHNNCLTSRRIIQCALSGRWFNTNTGSKNSLIASPYSLNLDIPISCRIPIEKAIIPALRSRCENELVKEVFSTRMDDMESLIMESLSKMSPFQPLIANDIYSRSIPGRRKTFISGLANTTSLGRLLYESSANPMIMKIRKLELNQLESWIIKFLDIQNCAFDLESIPAHHVLADTLRTMSWGVAMVGVTVPHPLEQFTLVKAQYDICGGACSSYRNEHLVLVRHNEDMITLPGTDRNHITGQRSRRGSPYLGSSISEGIIQQQIICVNPDETWRDIIRLNTIRKWVSEPGSSLDSLLIKIIQTRTDISLGIIDKATGMPSRLSYNHRASLMGVVNTCGVSTTTNMHSRLYLSSNRMGEYSHGEHNYHMPFGPAFLCYQELVCLLGVYSPNLWNQTPRSIYHIHVRNSQVPMVFDGSLNIYQDRIDLQPIPNISRILFSYAQNLTFETQSGFTSDHIWSDFLTAPLAHARLGYVFQLISDMFVKETIVRETLTHDHISSYTPRHSMITIGDINLVGIRPYIKAIAWNFLLLSPCRLWDCKLKDSFLVSAMSFITNFSHQFWETFLNPFSHIRLTTQLTNTYPTSISPTGTRHVIGLKDVLMDIVITEMWNHFNHLLNAIKRPNLISPIPLFVPSISSLKLMLSKYVELTVFLGLSDNDTPASTALGFARDFATNILSIENSMVESTIGVIANDYNLLLSHLQNEQRYLPYITIYSLQHPWIDRLRGQHFEQLLEPVELTVPRPFTYPRLHDVLTYEVHVSPVCVSCQICDCPAQERRTTLHTEYYFERSGPLSKSHIKILDIVLSLDLPVTGVMTLGTGTGTETYAFAKLAECERVYANCLIPLSSFSQHMAGSYIPSMFASGRLADKLVHPSAAVLASSDLLDTETIHAIQHHVSDAYFCGITCDAELSGPDVHDNLFSLLNNLITLIDGMPDIQWLLVKVPIRCRHELQELSSVISRAFLLTSVTYSPFSRPGSALIYIVGHIRKDIIDPLRDRFHIPVSILTSGDIDDFLARYKSGGFGHIFLSQRDIIRQRLFTLSLSDSSFETACRKYLPGWHLQHRSSSLRSDMRESLMSIRFDLEESARSLLQVFYRTHSELRQPRATILQLPSGPLHKKILTIYKNVNRCDLLIKLLRDPVINITESVAVIERWLVKSHQYYMHSRFFTFDLEATLFINTTSRFLFEILGHVYQENYVLGTNILMLDVYHKKQGLDETHQCEDLFLALPRQRRRPIVDVSWRWNRRSLILSWLFVSRITNSNILVLTDAPFLIDIFHSRSQLLNVHYVEQESQRILVCVCKTAGELRELQNHIMDEYFILLSLPLCTILEYYFHVSAYYKCPWTGVVPNVVLAHCGPLITPRFNAQCYPDFSPVVNAVNPAGLNFVGCKCWDCSVEHDIVLHLKISHSEIDRMCSLRVIETVMDKDHAL